MTSIQLLDYVQKQLPYENDVRNFQVASSNLKNLKTAYLPLEHIREYKAKTYGALMQILTSEKADELKEKALFTLYDFMRGSKDAEELGVDWLSKGFIHSKKENSKKLLSLNQVHKHRLLTELCSSMYVPMQKKEELLKQVLGDDKSDIAEETRLGCRASLPDPKVKEEVWKEFTDPNSKRSLSEKEAEMHNFSPFEQNNLIQPYRERFYGNLPEMYKSNSYKWFEAYFHSLLPRE